MERIDLSAILPRLRRSPSFERVRSALDAGRALTLGVGDAAKPTALAAIAGEREGPVLIVTTRADRAEALAEELAAWLGADAEVMLYPERDALPYERLAAAASLMSFPPVRNCRRGSSCSVARSTASGRSIRRRRDRLVQSIRLRSAPLGSWSRRTYRACAIWISAGVQPQRESGLRTSWGTLKREWRSRAATSTCRYWHRRRFWTTYPRARCWSSMNAPTSRPCSTRLTRRQSRRATS